MEEKRIASILCLALFILASLSAISAADTACSLNTTLINQDPYPAIPGDYVKLVFQVDGVQNSGCGEVSIKLNEEFPFSLDPGAQTSYSSDSFFERDYQSFLIAPFQVRVNKEAVDGANPIEVAVSYNKEAAKAVTLEKFNVEIEDKRVDFEVYVKNYDSATNTLTLEILNVGKSDVRAVTVKVPDQENISIKGASTNIVGDMDSNEYTTADFEAVSAGGSINLQITYTDGIDVRRSVEKNITFDPAYFTGRKTEQKSYTTWYIVGLIILIVLGVWIYRAFIRKKPKKVY